MSATEPILIGTHTYAAPGGAAERQAACIVSLRRLERAAIVNVQFADGAHHVDGVETLAVLRKDSRTVTGNAGPRKGIVSEILDALADAAEARGSRYFCFTNADIIWSQEAVDWILASGKEACIFSRRDVDGSADKGIELSGVDAVAIDLAWWRQHRHRFRDYIVGEICWDNTYTAVLMCHANAALENRLGLLRHQAHAPATPHAGFARYIQYLAALDAGYFHLWCAYWGRLAAMRERGAPAEEEQRLAREVFVWRPAPAARVVQAARNLKARLRYRVSRLGIP
jgi:hypothetical protein